MRLKSLTLSQYKNLKDFSLSFDGSSFIDVFVGKNGSGKSNLFEALILIFRHLYELIRRKAIRVLPTPSNTRSTKQKPRLAGAPAS